MVVAAPAGVGALDDVQETLTLALLVRVVVDGEKVAVFVEGDFLGVAQAAGENFKSAAIRIAAQHRALMRGEPVFPLLRGDVRPLVADGPIDPPVGTEGQPVHVVAGVGDVDPEAMGEGLPLVGLAVAIGVAEFPQVRGDGGIDIAAPGERPGRDPGHLGIEALGENTGGIHHPVAVLVGEADDLFGNLLEIVGIDLAVLVPILERGLGEFLRAVQLLAEEGQLVPDGSVGNILHRPALRHELPDVQIRDLPACGLRDVNRSVHIDRDRNGIFQQRLLRHERAFQAVRSGEGLCGGSRNAEKGQR